MVKKSAKSAKSAKSKTAKKITKVKENGAFANELRSAAKAAAARRLNK